MRFAICNEIFSDLPIETGFRLAAEIGFEGIEIAPFTLSEPLSADAQLTDVRTLSAHARSKIKEVAQRSGLEVVGLHWLFAKTEGFHITSPDPAIRSSTAEYLVALAQLCCDLGGRVLVLGSPQQRNLLPGVSHNQAEDYAAEVLSVATPFFEDNNVTLALEPLGPVESDFLNTAASAMALANRLESPACQLHLDVKAMSTEDTPIPEIIRAHKHELRHFHANDPNLLGPGMGDVEFSPILQTLEEIGYEGWVSVEVFRFEPSGETIARQSFANLQRALKG